MKPFVSAQMIFQRYRLANPTWRRTIDNTARTAFIRILIIFAVLATASSVQAQGNSKEDTAAAGFAYDSELSLEDNKTNLILKFDGRPEYRVFFMGNPARFVIELNGSDFRLGSHSSSESIGVVSEIRNGKITKNKSRMVITLAETAKMVSQSLQKAVDSNRHSLVLTLEATSADEFAEIIRKQKTLHGASGEAVVKGDRVRSNAGKRGHFTIVIDPGHGGIDGGATGSVTGAFEKDIVLEVGMLLGKLIEKSGPFEVLFTRDADVFISLRKRREFTRRANADLLISLHADSLRQKFVRGATIYTLAKKASDSLSRELAESENLSDVIAGMAAPDAQEDVTGILADLTMRETTRFSRSFSGQLSAQLENRIKLINNPRRSASFMVLKNAEIPGVLIELGYLSNKEDEARLTDPKWQEKVAALIAETVRGFFRGRQPVSTAN